MRQTNEKLRHRRKAFWWLKIKKGERKIKNHQGGEKTKQNQMNIKVLARFHPVGLCWVTVWWAQPVSETVPGSQQTTPKLNKHSKQAVLLPFHWSTKWGTWRRPCLKWHNLKTVESKFRAAWAHDWWAGPSKLTNSSPDVAVSISLVQKEVEETLPLCCLLPFGFRKLKWWFPRENVEALPSVP